MCIRSMGPSQETRFAENAAVYPTAVSSGHFVSEAGRDRRRSFGRACLYRRNSQVENDSETHSGTATTGT